MDFIQLIVALIAGAVGGNIGGAVAKDVSLGTAGNSVVGAVGGGLTSWLLTILGFLGTVATGAAGQAVATQTGFDLTHFLGNVAGSGVGGLILQLIVAYIKNASAAHKA